MVGQQQKLQALFGVLLLISVGPVSGLTAGLSGSGIATATTQAGNAGNQPTGPGAGNQPTTPGAGNQPTDPIVWNESTEPGPDQIESLGPRANESQPYAVVGDRQPTDPDLDGQYEDINGDGAINIVDVDALERNIRDPAVGANWTAYDYTGDGNTGAADVRWLRRVVTTRNSNDTDGDGLPNQYERNVTETDPEKIDTDGDGVIDGLEDWDGDGIPAAEEYRSGTDPRDNDTDGDGLPDDTELWIDGVSPTEADTDDEGTPDPREDLDGDGLVVEAELAANTTIGTADTDGDGLTDGAEVTEYGTDPLDSDTDDDGLTDSTEIELGTDPLVADSNGNGVPDGNENYTTQTSNEQAGVTVDVTGEGDVASDVEIRENTLATNGTTASAFQVATPASFETDRSFDNATLTFEYNESRVAHGANITVVYYNESRQVFEPIESSVDTENGTVSATVDHFSTYTVFNKTAWIERLETRDEQFYSGNETLPATNASVLNVESVDTGAYPIVTTDVTVDTPAGSGGELSRENFSVYDEGQRANILTVGVRNPSQRSTPDHDGPEPAEPASDGRSRNITVDSANPDIVVNKDGTGDYRTIQAGVNNANSGDTILVKRGTYREQVDVNTSVTLVGQNATLNGSEFTQDTAFTLNSSVTIAQFDIVDYEYGITDRMNNSTVSITDTSIEGGTYAIDADSSSNNWIIINLKARNLTDGDNIGITAEESTGDWYLSNVSLSGEELPEEAVFRSIRNIIWSYTLGITAEESTGDWHLSNVSLSGEDVLIRGQESTGDWHLSNISISAKEDANINAVWSTGDWHFSNTSLSAEAHDVHITGMESTGDWYLSNTSLSGDGTSIGGDTSKGDWYISNTTVTGGFSWIDAIGSDGDWYISNSKIIQTQSSGGSLIFAANSTGDLSLSRTVLDGGGIGGYSTTGNWSISRSQIQNTKYGVIAPQSQSNWTVQSTAFKNISNEGIRLSDNNTLAVHESNFNDTEVAINASEVNSTPDATRNWWGRAAGPSDGQVVGNVNTTNPCNQPCADYGGSTGQTVYTITYGAYVNPTQTTRNVTIYAETDSNSVSNARAEYQVPQTDSDGDGIADAIESQEIPLANGPTISLNPELRDTDDDGLTDGEELNVSTEDGRATLNPVFIEDPQRNETYFAGYEWISNPTERDTDGDGLTDSQEVTGWTIQRTTNASASQGYLNVSRPDPSQRLLIQYLRNMYHERNYNPRGRGPSAETERERAIDIARQQGINASTIRNRGGLVSPNKAYLTNVTVTSNPRAVDSDTDGLADNVEARRGTDPSRADTDGDGIDDTTEFSNGSAPVLFDHLAPTVLVDRVRTETINRELPDPKRTGNVGSSHTRTLEYTVRLKARDPSGVSELRFDPVCEYHLGTEPTNQLDSTSQCQQFPARPIEYDNVTETPYRTVEFTVRYDVTDGSVTPGQEVGQLYESAPVGVTAVDRHGNSRSSDYTSPGAIPELAAVVANQPLTSGPVGNVAENKVIEEIAFSNGAVWGFRRVTLDLSYFIQNPESAVTWILNLDSVIDGIIVAPERVPTAADNLQDRQNPFDEDSAEENYRIYRNGWLAGYGTGIVGPEVAIGLGTGGGSTLSKASRVRKITDTLSTVRRVPRGWTTARSVRMAVRISDDPDISRTGTFRAVRRVSIPRRVAHADRLNSERWQDLIKSIDTSNGPPPVLQVSRSMRRTGEPGRELMLDLHRNGDQQALEAFVAMDDTPRTQRAFARAYGGDVDRGEVTTTLKRYDELDADEKRTADRIVARGGDDGIRLLNEEVCNSPCDSFTEAWHEFKQTDSVSPNDATIFRNKLLGGIQRGEISDDRAADLLGDAKKLATDEGRDVTDVINRDDRFSRALLREYDESDSVGTETLSRMDRIGEIDLPDDQIESKYKHADDFGVTGNNNPENQEAIREAIAEHAVNSNTERIEGGYTRLEGDQSVTHLYNPNTGNNIIIDDGEFLTGFKLTQGQRQNMRDTGVIGGG